MGISLDIKEILCYTISMLERLRKRLPNKSKEELLAINSILETYNITPTINNLDGKGFLFEDLKGRTARVMVGFWKKKEVYIQDPCADIMILNLDGLNVGWIESSKLEDLEDRFVVKLSTLLPMPDSFSFDQRCAHLAEHGGFFEGKHWTCCNCGVELIFNAN